MISTRPNGGTFLHKTASIAAIDPNLLFAPCSTTFEESLFEPCSTIFEESLFAPCSATFEESVRCEPPRRRPEACKASLVTQDDPDFEVDDISGLDDDEYTPEETKRSKRKKRILPPKYRAQPNKKHRTMMQRSFLSPSPNGTVPNPKHRARNLPSSTDAVEHELERISRIKGAAKKKRACGLCPKSFSRQSDLRRHVVTHDPQHANSAVCCGISEEEALEHNIDSRHLNTYHFNDELRIGGCGMEFSRSDALLRHVKLRTSQCILLSEF